MEPVRMIDLGVLVACRRGSVAAIPFSSPMVLVSKV